MNQFGDARGYAISRRTLVGAIQALASFPNGSFVLVGAHAVYLRAPEDVPHIATSTLDGDLAADPRTVRTARAIFDNLERAGFVLRSNYGGFYSYPDVEPDEQYASKIDILVPEAFQYLWDREGYTERDRLAVHPQPGLELCLLDHSPLPLSTLHANGGEVVEVPVASVPALVVAKGWKLGERYELGQGAFEEVFKDVADVYRLLRVLTPEGLDRAMRKAVTERRVHDVVKKGAEYVRELCGSRGPGIELLGSRLGDSEEARIALASLEVLAEDFTAAVQSFSC